LGRAGKDRRSVALEKRITRFTEGGFARKGKERAGGHFDREDLFDIGESGPG